MLLPITNALPSSQVLYGETDAQVNVYNRKGIAGMEYICAVVHALFQQSAAQMQRMLFTSKDARRVCALISRGRASPPDADRGLSAFRTFPTRDAKQVQSYNLHHITRHRVRRNMTLDTHDTRLIMLKEGRQLELSGRRRTSESGRPSPRSWVFDSGDVIRGTGRRTAPCGCGRGSDSRLDDQRNANMSRGVTNVQTRRDVTIVEMDGGMTGRRAMDKNSLKLKKWCIHLKKLICQWK
jgi:hypothetical protein